MDTILIIDDNESDHELLALVFSERHPSVRLQHMVDGNQAMQQLMSLPAGKPAEFSLIILDLHLPLVNGLELLAFIKSDVRYAGVRTVMLTSSDLHTDREAAKRLGADGYLIKPADYQGYVEVVDRMTHHIQSESVQVALRNPLRAS